MNLNNIVSWYGCYFESCDKLMLYKPVMKQKTICVNCGNDLKGVSSLPVCEECRMKISFLTDDTIRKHIELFRHAQKTSYKEEIQRRLTLVEKEYIVKKLKLLHVLKRVEVIETDN